MEKSSPLKAATEKPKLISSIPPASSLLRKHKPPRTKFSSGLGRVLQSLRRFPTLGQHVECQRVTVGVLIAFQHPHRRQHVPDAVIIEDIRFTRLAHREAIQFPFVIVGDD